ncbi:MAG: YmdB family metallophosphoesterase [Alphaproteobacteria bacterium]|nr:YmdB family metallophosphoesterase [Alphaproteobacteria bacterium]
MRLLFCGDVVGRSGREAVTGNVPVLRQQLGIDFVVANGENAAGGFGITLDLARELLQGGVDVITTGNHVWDQRQAIGQIAAEPRLLRPLNFPPGTPGRGAAVFPAPGGRKVFVVNLMGRLFMDALDDPFQAVERELRAQRMGPGGVDAIVVDIHAEATSEKMAVGHFCDGRVSLVVGSHSHVPTADGHILPGGTAYQTDAGMCADYDSVIGMQKGPAVQRFVRKMPGEKPTAAEGPGTLCAVYVETDDRTGLAKRIAPVRAGGKLSPAMP